MDTDLESHFLKVLNGVGFPHDQRLAVAYSGGSDSTALLVLATQCLGAGRVVAFHVNHGVREAAADDAKHCHRVAHELGVAFHERALPPGKVKDICAAFGVEGGLRELRYATLQAMCSDYEVEFLATGHHGEDLLETHFLALIRGSGLTGAAGPRLRRALSPQLTLIRPLLATSRQDLLAFLGTTAFVDDETNEDPRFLRNRVRRDLLPIVFDIADSRAPLYRSMELLASDRADLEELLRSRLEQLGVETDADTLDLRALESLDGPVARGAVRLFFSSQNGGFPPSRELAERVLSALSEPGRTRWIDAPGLRLRIENRRVLVETEPPESAVVPLQIPFARPTSSTELGVTVTATLHHTPGCSVASETRVFFDADALAIEDSSELWLRAARAGDRFHPFGLHGTVRLFRWLAGQGVPRMVRSAVPVVVFRDEIVWVLGMRRSCHAPISDRTARYLMINYSFWT